MQSRIDRLEGLVLSLMTNGSQSAGPAAAVSALAAPNSNDSVDFAQDRHDLDGTTEREADGDGSDVDTVTNSFGLMKVDANKSMYVGTSHWAAILSEVSPIPNDLMIDGAPRSN